MRENALTHLIIGADMGMSNPKTTQLGRLVAYLTLTRRKQKFCTLTSTENTGVSPVCLNMPRDSLYDYSPEDFNVTSILRRYNEIVYFWFIMHGSEYVQKSLYLQFNSCPQRKHRCVEIIWSKHESHYSSSISRA